MGLRFWLSFLISTFLCLLMVFVMGGLLVKNHDITSQRYFLKRNIKLESLLYLDQLHKQFDFWRKEKEQIIKEDFISSDSPFFALILFSSSQEETVYITEDTFPLQNQKGEKAPPKGKALPQSDLKKTAFADYSDEAKTEKRDILIQFSKEIRDKGLPEGFLLKSVKIKEMEQPLVLIRVLEKGKEWIGFFKFHSEFFQFSLDFLNVKNNSKKEFFVINPQGQVFFHSRESMIFKKISKKSRLWESLSLLLKQKTDKGKYIKLHKKRGKEEIYYLQHWGKGGMLLIAKTGFFLPFFVDSLMVWVVCLAIFLLFFLLLSVKFFSLVSAYRFLKYAFLSFGKTKVLPSASSSNNSLLYFYTNRQLFFNQKYKEEDVFQQKETQNLTFQNIVNREIQKIQSEVANLYVNKKYVYDTKIFGFERFLRTIVHELLLNAVESMGSLRKLRLDLSLKKEGENIVFCVRDYGVGVRDQNYTQLFEMYYSTKSQLGVGLNLVQSLITANDGDIQLSSPEGGGLKVCISLPLKSFLKSYSTNKK